MKRGRREKLQPVVKELCHFLQSSDLAHRATWTHKQSRKKFVGIMNNDTNRPNQHQLLGRLNRENQHPIQQVNTENKYLNATSHTGGVKTDMAILSKFVREELFYVFVHDFKNENDDCLSLACDEFIAYCLEAENKGLITNPHIQHASEKEFKAYLKFLWKEGLKTNWKGKGNIRRDLSNEKSAVYAAIADKFKSKCCLPCREVFILH